MSKVGPMWADMCVFDGVFQRPSITANYWGARAAAGEQFQNGDMITIEIGVLSPLTLKQHCGDMIGQQQ